MNANAIQRIMRNLDKEAAAVYFNTRTEEHIDPFGVCDAVSMDAFNSYGRYDNSLPIAKRFLSVTDDRQLVIVDWSSAVHERTIRNFEYVFPLAIGFPIGGHGSMTVEQEGKICKEANTTYDPQANTPNLIQVRLDHVLAGGL